MSNPTTTHSTFVIERRYDATPARVFKAFADPDAKAKWFSGPEDQWTPQLREADFRVGGHERAVGKFKNGPVSDFRAFYQDIVQDRRIIYSYTMHIDDKKISVSQQTIELSPDGKGTALKLTEHGAYLDGYDDAGARERGTKDLMDALGRSLKD